MEKYGIRQVVISPYNPQANGMIEVGHRPIADALSKMTQGGTTTGMDGWVTHLPAVLLADRTTVKASTGMTPFRMLYGEEAVLPIELDVPTWQTLPWTTVRSTDELVAMRARQIKRRDVDVDEARAHLQRMRLQGKEHYDKIKNLIKDPPQKDDLVLLHDTKAKKTRSAKLKFRWSGPYRVRDVINEKGTYFLEELDGTPFRKNFHGNRIKRFWARDKSMYVPIDDSEEEESDAGEENDPIVDKEQQQDDENEARWIPPGQDFAVVI